MHARYSEALCWDSRKEKRKQEICPVLSNEWRCLVSCQMQFFWNTNTAMYFLLKSQGLPYWQHLKCSTELSESLWFTANCEEKGLQQLTRYSVTALPLLLLPVTRRTKQSTFLGSAGFCCCNDTCCSQRLLTSPFQTHNSRCQEKHSPSEHFCNKGDPD